MWFITKLPLRNPLTKAIASMICCKGNNSLPLSRVCMNVVWPDESVYNIYPFTYGQSQMLPLMSKITKDPWRQVWWFLNVVIPELMAIMQTLLSSHSHIPDQCKVQCLHNLPLTKSIRLWTVMVHTKEAPPSFGRDPDAYCHNCEIYKAKGWCDRIPRGAWSVLRVKCIKYHWSAMIRLEALN